MMPPEPDLAEAEEKARHDACGGNARPRTHQQEHGEAGEEAQGDQDPVVDEHWVVREKTERNRDHAHGHHWNAQSDRSLVGSAVEPIEKIEGLSEKRAGVTRNEPDLVDEIGLGDRLPDRQVFPLQVHGDGDRLPEPGFQNRLEPVEGHGNE